MFFKQAISLVKLITNKQSKSFSSNSSKTNWKSQDNIKFYRKNREKQMDSFAKAAGLDTCCDLDVLLSQLNLTGDICEIGSGKGRVIQGLINRGIKPQQLTAVERDDLCVQYLKNHFDDALTIYHQDVQDSTFSHKYQAFLLMWGFICEIPVEEQLTFLFHLQLHLTTSGVIACDTPRYGEPNKSNITNFNGQNIRIEKPNQPTWYGYNPQEPEMIAYGESMGMKCRTLPYVTTTKRERVIYLYEKETNDNIDTKLTKRLIS